MMRTKTRFHPLNGAEAWINDIEAVGWAVRQIVVIEPNENRVSPGTHVLVVFERDDD